MRLLFKSTLLAILIGSFGLALLMCGAFADSFSLPYPRWVRFGIVSTFLLAVLVCIAAGMCLWPPKRSEPAVAASVASPAREHVVPRHVLRAVLLPIVFVFLVVVAFRVVSRTRDVAATVSVSGLVTNTAGRVTALVAVSNGGPSSLWFAVGRQVQTESGWRDPADIGRSGRISPPKMWEPEEPLRPGTERLVEIPAPTNELPWRVFAWHGKTYSSNWVGQVREKAADFFDSTDHECSYSSEILR